MRVRIPNYTMGYKVVSLSLDEKTKLDLEDESVEFIYVDDKSVVAYPEQCTLTEEALVIQKFKGCNNYDVFEIYEDGIASRYYDDSTVENTFFITEKCNSNCIMCPSPEYSRKRGSTVQIDDLINIASHIPSDVSHITITGGEPFMVGKDLFRLLTYCRDKFESTEFQILTNGRVFALPEYVELLQTTMPNQTVLGIPLHGSCEKIHDGITQTKNSFKQTMIGLKRLQVLGISTEIRIVAMKNNAKDVSRIAELITKEINQVNHVSIMAMEMTGSAHANSDEVWIPYKKTFEYIKPAVDILVNEGIDTRLYNFPLCAVDAGYRTLCNRSISSWKVRYAEVCEKCTIRESCGGVFAGTIRLVKDELEAVL